jgi:hypothetical protein
VLVPGGQVLIASNPLLSNVVAGAAVRAGFERRAPWLIRQFCNSSVISVQPLFWQAGRPPDGQPGRLNHT